MLRLGQLIAVLGVLAPVVANGQTLGIGDPAPALEIETWIKGQPVDLAKDKGKTIYVIEFWATWCPPCVQSIPHLTAVQKHYQDKNVVIVSISDEPVNVVKSFTDQQGERIGYTVATDRAGKTHAAYMLASGQMGIPTAFIVTADRKIAWIGSPFAIDSVLEEVVTGTFDIAKAKQRIAAEEKFFKTQYTELLMAIQMADWATCTKIGRAIADPSNRLPKALRSQIMHSTAWAMLDHEQADPKYFTEALYLAKAAYDICGCEEASIIDTYARALFDNGRMGEAVKYQQEAIGYADDMMKVELQESLKKYELAAGTGS